MRALTAKLFVKNGTNYSGTAWLCSHNYALTAAHCVGDRVRRTLRNGPFHLTFDWGEVETQDVKRIDFDLDVALLSVPASEIPDTLSFADYGVLPPAFQGQHGHDTLWWSAFGYPLAHPGGMVINGTIDSPDGRVGGNPAIQLTCEQGGFGALNGMSGAAVLHSSVIVGLVRYGPPALKQRVIYAAPMSLIIAGFTELKEIKLVSLTPERDKYSRQELASALSRLLLAQFESVIFSLNVPSDVIPGQNSPQRMRAIEAVIWAESQGEERVRQLIDEIEREAPGLLKGKQ